MVLGAPLRAMKLDEESVLKRSPEEQPTLNAQVTCYTPSALYKFLVVDLKRAEVVDKTKGNRTVLQCFCFRFPSSNILFENL